MKVRDLPQHKDSPRASVLVPLFLRSNILNVVLTQRPVHLTTYSGDVCFPGGLQDPQDQNDDVETAFREANEEIGLDRKYILPLCRSLSVESLEGLCVTPVVALIDPPQVVDQLLPSENEVEEVFSLPVEFFLERNGNISDSYDVPWLGGTYTNRTYWHQNKSDGRNFKIRGITSHIIHEVARIAIDGDCSNTEVADQMSSNRVAVPTLMEGELWIWDGRKQAWAERYWVLTEKILHQYSLPLDLKSTKKRRLPLHGISVQILKQENDMYPFLVCVPEVGVEMRLGCKSLEIREKWCELLRLQ